MQSQFLALQIPNPQVRIRPVRLSDIEQLQVHCWPERTLASIHQLIGRAQQSAQQGRGLGVVVADLESNILRGYGQLTLWHNGAEISDLIITELYRRRGMGTAIIQYLVRTARDMHAPFVEIGAALSNPGALALYRRLGFKDNHQITLNLGQGQEPVIYLRLDLQPATPKRKM